MDAITDTEHWLNIEQAREKACVTRRTIYNWMDKGRLTTKRTAGGAVRILESSLWRPAEERQGYVECSERCEHCGWLLHLRLHAHGCIVYDKAWGRVRSPGDKPIR